MKKLFMGAMALSTFAMAICLVQISCSKINAQSSNKSVEQLNKIVFSKEIIVGGVGSSEIWTADYDGSNQVQIPIVLPTDFYIETNNNANAVRLSPDGQTVFFTGNYTTAPSGTKSSIYACAIDGNNFRLVVQGATQLMRLGGAY